ncbi:MAG: helix-turn-helix domain-containing protein [Parvularculaceae bacterium]
MKHPSEIGRAPILAKTIGSRRHVALIALLKRERVAAGITQTEVAKVLGEHQSFIARLETGQRRVDVVEFRNIAQVLGFDPKIMIKRLEAK